MLLKGVSCRQNQEASGGQLLPEDEELHAVGGQGVGGGLPSEQFHFLNNQEDVMRAWTRLPLGTELVNHSFPEQVPGRGQTNGISQVKSNPGPGQLRMPAFLGTSSPAHSQQKGRQRAQPDVHPLCE